MTGRKALLFVALGLAVGAPFTGAAQWIIKGDSPLPTIIASWTFATIIAICALFLKAKK